MEMTYNPENWKKNNKDMDYNNSSRRLRPLNSRPHVWTAHRLPSLKVQKDIRCKTRNNEIAPNIPCIIKTLKTMALFISFLPK